MRCRLLLGISTAAANFSNPIVALIRSFRTALPTASSPPNRHSPLRSTKTYEKLRPVAPEHKLSLENLLSVPFPFRPRSTQSCNRYKATTTFEAAVPFSSLNQSPKRDLPDGGTYSRTATVSAENRYMAPSGRLKERRRTYFFFIRVKATFLLAPSTMR